MIQPICHDLFRTPRLIACLPLFRSNLHRWFTLGHLAAWHDCGKWHYSIEVLWHIVKRAQRIFWNAFACSLITRVDQVSCASFWVCLETVYVYEGSWRWDLIVAHAHCRAWTVLHIAHDTSRINDLPTTDIISRLSIQFSQTTLISTYHTHLTITVIDHPIRRALIPIIFISDMEFSGLLLLFYLGERFGGYYSGSYWAYWRLVPRGSVCLGALIRISSL